MTMDFVDGFLAAMLPSVFTVAWLVGEQPRDLIWGLLISLCF
jgi:hypothetical protein